MSTIDALQAWLALEHEAVWLYPVIGARRDDLVQRARRSFTTHRDTRDELETRLAVLDAEPVSGALTYDVGPLTTVAEAQAVAQALEARIAAACLALVAATEGDERAAAIRALTKAAAAELTWKAEPRAFPGLPEAPPNFGV